MTHGDIPLNLRFFGNFVSGFENLITLSVILRHFRHLEAEMKGRSRPLAIVLFTQRQIKATCHYSVYTETDQGNLPFFCLHRDRSWSLTIVLFTQRQIKATCHCSVYTETYHGNLPLFCLHRDISWSLAIVLFTQRQIMVICHNYNWL
jgi:hypothetical protein